MSTPTGAVYEMTLGYASGNYLSQFTMDSSGLDVSRVHPVASRVKVPSWGALACVYLGQPAS